MTPLFPRKTPSLPAPSLARGLFTPAGGGEPLAVWTDEALLGAVGVRVAFAERSGGASDGAFSSLDLADHVGDEPARVTENRERLMSALGLDGVPLVAPRQVHGDRVVALRSASAQTVGEFRSEAAKGADALLVEAAGVCALVNAADCVQVALVAPSGRFAAVHAGWRGVEGGIVAKALRRLVLGEPGLSTDASCVNVYRGAFIHAECFETGEDVHRLFTDRFGNRVAPDETHIDLGRALDAELVRAGVDPARIADVGQCTVCCNDRWFSYRAQKGSCGRHGLLVCRMR